MSLPAKQASQHATAVVSSFLDEAASLDDCPVLLKLTSTNSDPTRYQKRSEVQSFPAATPLTRSKSVTFTLDTKKASESSTQEITQDHLLSDPTPVTLPKTAAKPAKKEKKKARQQKGAASNQAASEPSSTDTSASGADLEYVRYLEQYHTDRSSWKFSKKKQKDLLKNLFNIHKIPPEHNDALIAYIAGLQGAGAQQRLFDDAEAVLKTLLEKQERSGDLEDMDSRAERKAAYNAALQREIDKLDQAGGGCSEYDAQQLQEIRRDVERGKRADAVLAELLGKELAPAVSPTPNVEFQGPHQDPASSPMTTVSDTRQSKTITKRRKRKARTEVSSEESSSSSSESEGD